MKPVYDSALPAGWLELPLQDAVRLKRGYSWSKDQEVLRPQADTVPVIRIPNIQSRLDLTSLLHLRGVPAADLRDSAVTMGWILFVASNGNENRIGDSVLVDCDMQMVFASFLMGMTPEDSSTLLPEFLALWMRIHNVHEAFSKTSQRTTGLGNFSWSAVRRLPVRFPASVAEQRAIAELVGLVDSYIALTSTKGRFLRDLSSSLESHTETDEDDGDQTEGLGVPADTTCPDAELEAMMRLKLALLQEVVTGKRRLR